MNFENEYLIKLNKYIKDKCSNVCGFDIIDEKLIMNYEKHIVKNDLNLFKNNFQCFEKCSSKYFESGIVSLQSLEKFMS